MMAWTEAEAVYFSDVITTHMVGIERFEEIINPTQNPNIVSLGRAFRDLEISNEDARQCLIDLGTVYKLKNLNIHRGVSPYV